ncbi:hypothetical protein AMS58_17810 [Pseudoalteromonas porphyrae]|uniref:Uncharacterized protein n=1 Tax=Pseudoalteromonas porphyrae TaxID=187330 RepID=A0A0N1EF52_9GAMM|nr:MULTISPECIES: hypothetical protein [Pseudoalteromonas]KPH58596.1 hypothetical protein ADS77_17580 [Pseudoalteromonas porphyrae]KPH93297.1 hypothetical protein AMS58_17810 [Pseudoalteromonas porphyrae]
MSNLLHRICSHAMLFTLLMSVSLTVLAHDFDNQAQHTNANYIACDIPDQANLDVDIDTHDNGLSLGALHPLPDTPQSFYLGAHLAKPFNHAYQRGPPAYSI